MTELVKMPFGLWAPICPGNDVLDGSSDLPWEGAIFGERVPIVKYREEVLP